MFEVSDIVDRVIAERADQIKLQVLAAANRKVDDLLQSIEINVPLKESDFAQIVGYSEQTIARLRKDRQIQWRGIPGRPYYLFPADVDAFHERMKHERKSS